MLNFPKTGSSFVRSVLKEIFKQRYQPNLLDRLNYFLGLSQPALREIFLPNIKSANGRKDQHGTYSQIPQKYLDRPVVSVVRNPYTKFISAYEFKFWAKHLPIPKSIINNHLPNFPNLSLDEFVTFSQLSADHKMAGQNKFSLGNQTIQFLQMFFPSPEPLLIDLNSQNELNPYNIILKMGGVDFLTQENLRSDLANYLLKHGFTLEESETARNYKTVNKTKSMIIEEPVRWTQKAVDYITLNEKLLLELLELKGLNYDKPKVGQTIR